MNLSNKAQILFLALASGVGTANAVKPPKALVDTTSNDRELTSLVAQIDRTGAHAAQVLAHKTLNDSQKDTLGNAAFELTSIMQHSPATTIQSGDGSQRFNYSLNAVIARSHVDAAYAVGTANLDHVRQDLQLIKGFDRVASNVGLQSGPAK